jgi:histidinol-phosphate phosphatase family protein
VTRTGPQLQFDVVIPTAGRASLAALLEGLAAQHGPAPGRVVLVDDRRRVVPAAGGLAAGGLAARVPAALLPRTVVARGFGAGPAAARNTGWRATRAPWVAFLDDDVMLPPGWAEALERDLAALPAGVAGSQGRLRVPLAPGRRPTDWERNVEALERAVWATADLACRRTALERVGGFDERFRRAYREDADFGLRLLDEGLRIERGRRETLHPVGDAPWWVSLHKQAGNAEDPFMQRLHGPGWRARAAAPAGRMRRHAATAAVGLAAAGLALARRPAAALPAAGAWAALTAELAWARIAPGPRNRDEVLAMGATSVAMPFVATAWRAAGMAMAPGRARGPRRRRSPPAAVLFDRDGTLVVDVPYNGDPARVRPLPGARAALDRVRAAGVALGVVSNQSGIARGVLTRAQVDAVNARVEALLGPLRPWAVCPHGPGDGCACRKPAPGLVLRAAAALGVDPAACVVIGDIGADVEAARAAAARGILVPTPATRREEVLAAPELAPDLAAAVDLLFGACPPAERVAGAGGAAPEPALLEVAA